jgi:hypothetical protein
MTTITTTISPTIPWGTFLNSFGKAQNCVEAVQGLEDPLEQNNQHDD